MPFKFERKGDGVQAIQKRIKKPGTVDVGIIGEGKHESGDSTVAGVGYIHEFGMDIIPERSFMRATTKKEKKNIVALQKKLMKQIRAGDIKVEKALGIIGIFIADKISQAIVKISEPPNAPSTIKKKGSSNPLIDTGQLKNSITYEVNR